MDSLTIWDIIVGVFFGNFFFWMFSTGFRIASSDEEKGVERIGTYAMIAAPLIFCTLYLLPL